MLLAWLNDFILGSMRNVKNVMKRICAVYEDSRKKHFEPPHNKTNKMTFVPREDSDPPGHPPGHPPSLIRVFAVRSMGSLNTILLQADRVDPDQTGRILVLSCRGSIFILKPVQKPLRMAL